MEEYKFSNSNIDLASEKVGKFLAKAGVERREALRTKLTFEEVLLEYQSEFGEDATFKLKCIKHLLSIKVEIIIEGKSYDPFNKEGKDDDVIRNLLSKMGLAPTWHFKNGKNRIVFIPKKKHVSDTVKMAIAIGMAVIAGIVMNFLPEGISSGINQYALTPVTDAIMGLISAVSGPLIFLSVLGSILSMGNMETLGKIGAKTIKAILIYMSVIGVGMTLLGCLFYRVEWGGGGESSFSQVLDLIFDIVPTNLIEPFITGNALQLIFISIMVGLAMLVLASRVSGIFTIVDQLNSIVQTIMTGLSSLLPILIFVLFTGMISSGELGSVLNSWKLVVVMLILIVAYYVGNILFIAIRKRVSPVLLFKKACPTLLIALTTASSAAAYGTNTRDATKKFGIDKKLVEFGTPIGQVLFMPGFVALLFCMEASFAESCGIPITVPWIIIGLVTNVLLAFAVPPVPGSGMTCFAIAFAQLGIPAEMMGIALAVDMITDFPATSVNVSSWQLTLVNVADSLKMLDKETLRKKN